VSHARTRRTWRVVGIVTPDDVKAMQSKVATYQATLQGVVDALTKAGKPLVTDQSQWSASAWSDLGTRVAAFQARTQEAWNPIDYLSSGSLYEQGRALITEQDGWRDELARRNAPNVPPPLAVPKSDLGLAGGVSLLALAALGVFLFLRDRR